MLMKELIENGEIKHGEWLVTYTDGSIDVTKMPVRDADAFSQCYDFIWTDEKELEEKCESAYRRYSRIHNRYNPNATVREVLGPVLY